MLTRRSATLRIGMMHSTVLASLLTTSSGTVPPFACKSNMTFDILIVYVGCHLFRHVGVWSAVAVHFNADRALMRGDDIAEVSLPFGGRFFVPRGPFVHPHPTEIFDVVPFPIGRNRRGSTVVAGQVAHPTHATGNFEIAYHAEC